MRIRIYTNVAQVLYNETDPLKAFFIRPEDIDLYNRRYISTFEFYFPEDVDLNWDVLYKAYVLNKKWLGPLKEIIIGLNSDIEDTTIMPRWAAARMDCHRKCFKGSSCNICNQIYELSKSLKEIQVKYQSPANSKETAKFIMQDLDNKTVTSDIYFKPPEIPNFEE